MLARLNPGKGCLLVALIASFILQSSAQPQSDALNQSPDQPGYRTRKTWSEETSRREAWLWHELNRQRLERTHPLGAAALHTDIVNQDINDISVIQGDTRLITPENAFDLNGRAVQFTSSGSSYTLSNAASLFDNNLGSKLDMTIPPAVNPKVPGIPGIEAGDDAYILQDLGFSFSFFGSSFSSVAVSSNGNLTFRPNGISNSVFDNGTVNAWESLTELQTGLPRIAPYWHDLDARASQTPGATGVYFRKDNDRVVVTWNNIRDFPNDPPIDRGVHRFQVTLFSDGRILATYDAVQLTSTAICGISLGGASGIPSLVDLRNPPSSPFANPIAELFSTSIKVDVIGTIQAFYAAHPNHDVYDFLYIVTDFSSDLGGAFAFYLPLRSDETGIGPGDGQSSSVDLIPSARIQGLLNLANIAADYPPFPTTRFLGANHALSIMGQEQGHRWLAYISYPGGDPTVLLGRDGHWSFFLNIESTMSSPAARRSSSAEGNVWRDNGDGSLTTVNLVDGYSRLDQYLIGVRPAMDVPDTFVIVNPTNTIRTSGSFPRPFSTCNGTKRTVTISDITQLNGQRSPNAAQARKNFRAAIVLLARQGAPPSQTTLNKVTRYRLAWESYFAQSNDYLATISTGLADQPARFIAAVSSASYTAPLAPAEIGALFGVDLTAGGTELGGALPLPTTLAGTQVLVNGVAAPLFFASPGQINFQIPRSTTATTFLGGSIDSSTATIEVFSNGQLIRAGASQIAPSVPAIFTRDLSGSGPAAALDGFTFTGPPFNATQPNGQPNIVAVFGTGLGADATDTDGNVSANTEATFDGNPMTINYAGRAPSFIGLNQFNLVFPVGVTPGTHTLVVKRNGVQSNVVSIAVR